MAGLNNIFKKFFLYHEPEKSEKFILTERQSGVTEKKDKNDTSRSNKTGSSEKKSLNRNPTSQNGDLPEESDNEGQSLVETEEKKVSKNLSENLQFIKKIFSIPINGDVVLREFDIIVKDKVISAFMVFFDGMVDRKVINDDILQPLMLLSNIEMKASEKDVSEFILSHLLPHNQLKLVQEHQDVIDEVNFGGCGIYVDGLAAAFAADVKGWEHRGIERPNTEILIRGPQEGFNESLRSNTALIRKRLKDQDLIAETILIGKRSKTPCSMLYIRDIANDSLVGEVRRRLKGISVDYMADTGALEQMIEDSSFLPSPQIIATERPDRVAIMLTGGRVAVVLNGSPFALVMPVGLIELIQSPEDQYVRFPYSNLLRFVRIFAVFMSLLLPGLYLAITNYHQEMLPTDLLFAIEAAREKVPFPSLIEILIMEVSFELIREAGIRIPGPIGPTLGIIGALILGQAAVAANIVSPILIIIVAVTGIGSFAVPNFSLAFSIRILRFIYIFLGALAGLLGITLGLFMEALWLVSTKSFGVPFLVPFAPVTGGAFLDDLVRAPIWKQEKRPDYLNPKDKRRQAKISRKWEK